MTLLGDAAGMINPSCRNGNSMAMQSSNIATAFIDEYLKKKIVRKEMENGYTKKWRQTFAKRLVTGRLIQKMFGKEWVTNCFVGFMKQFPLLTKMIIKQTYGEPF